MRIDIGRFARRCLNGNLLPLRPTFKDAEEQTVGHVVYHCHIFWGPHREQGLIDLDEVCSGFLGMPVPMCN